MDSEDCGEVARERRIEYEVRELFHEANRLPENFPRGRGECLDIGLSSNGEPVKVYHTLHPYERFEE